MPLTFLLDENMRGKLPHAIQRHNARGGPMIEAICVGDPPALPLGSKDDDILLWAELHGRLLLTFDASTMKTALARHLAAGHSSPGVLILNRGLTIPDIVDALALIAHTGFPHDYADQAVHVP